MTLATNRRHPLITFLLRVALHVQNRRVDHLQRPGGVLGMESTRVSLYTCVSLYAFVCAGSNNSLLVCGMCTNDLPASGSRQPVCR